MSNMATLTIDWDARKFTLAGMCGDSSQDLSEKQVLRFLQRKSHPNFERFALVYYEDQDQLCCQDLELFKDENLPEDA